MFNKICGKFKRIIYRSDNFNVIVFKISPDQSNQRNNLEIDSHVKYINVISTNLDLDLNLEYEIELDLKNNSNSRYKKNYYLINKRVILSEDKNSVIKYLSSSHFKGISLKIATKIVENLGNNIISNIQENEEKIIDLVGKKKASIIVETILKEEKYNKILNIFLNENFSMSIFNFLRNKYPNNIEKILEEKLIEKIDEFILFDFFDFIKIASYFSKNFEDSQKDSFLILFELFKLEEQGSTINNVENLYRKVIQYKKIDLINFKNNLKYLYDSNLIVIHQSKVEVTSKMIYEKEKYICKKLKDLSSRNNKFDLAIENIQLSLLDKKQKEAIEKSLSNSVCIISGGPGTGKTMLISILVDYFENQKIKNYQILAPTGKAAIQISKKTTIQAKTFHSFLRWNEYFFEINENNPTNVEIVVIDEFSMININLLYSLFISCPKLKQVIFIGDKDQLPAIGPGYLINDFISSNKIVTIILDKIYRQNEGSIVASNSLKIRDGKLPDFNELNKMIEIKDSNTFYNQLLKEFDSKFNKNINEIQILVPMYKSDFGIDKINNLIQNHVNEKNDVLFSFSDKNFYENDKVIQLENNLEKNVFNGEIGNIINVELNVDKEIEKIIIKFEGDKVVEYALSEFKKDISLAYAISIHKFQGSECDHIILVLTEEHENMLSKKLFYTGYTRAKKTVTIFSSEKLVKRILKNDLDSNRKCNILNLINDL